MHQDRRLAPPARSSEAGFALIEVIVSAVVLAIVALAVLSGLDGAANGAARERSRSVAASIAEQDQERLRAMRAEDLGDLSETNTKEIDGIDYTIESHGEWVSDSTGGTTSCTNNEDQVDYIKITTTVTANVVGRRTQPTTITGLVAPPAGRARGTLAVKVVDRNADPVVGLQVYIERANPDTEFSTGNEATNEVGCAVFPRIPIGNYEVELREPGWVGRDGDNPKTVGTVVNNGAVTLESIEFDRAGTINVSFSSMDPRVPGDPVIASRGMYANVFHADSADRAATGGTLASTIGIGSLFPFNSAYGVYAGRCGASQPDSTYFENNPGASALVGPGATTPITVRQPPLRIQVGRDNNAANTDPRVRPTTFTPSQNTTVKARLADGSCSEEYLDLVTTSGTADTGGWVTKRAVTGYAYDPGVPFGTWNICAQVVTGSGSTRHADYQVTVGETGSARLWLEPRTQGNLSGSCP